MVLHAVRAAIRGWTGCEEMHARAVPAKLPLLSVELERARTFTLFVVLNLIPRRFLARATGGPVYRVASLSP